MQPRILVVDDEKLIRWSGRERLGKEGFDVMEAPDGATATLLLDQDPPDLALLDIRLPDTSGLALLKKIQEAAADLPVIMITAYSSINGAVEAIRSGAYDYVTKPFDMDELALTVRRALEASALRQQLSEEANTRRSRHSLENIIAESKSMMGIKDLIRRIAGAGASTVLVLGESGVGKDMIARAIHYESDRSEKPFMHITCSALPEGLLESALFGHEKGAFTDAKSRKRGLFEIANGGSAYLDEIGEMPPSLQAKLLRVLEEKTFSRIGGTREIQVDVRLIAATNRDLDEAVDEGSFREDLYYRLNTVQIYVPPLRERTEDIPALTEHFLDTFRREFGKPHVVFTQAAQDKLMRYPWPGNVRELRNTVERAVLLAEKERLDADDIILGREDLRGRRPKLGAVVKLPREGVSLETVERELVQQALDYTSGNQTRAAALLGITRDQIRYKIAKFGLTDSEGRPSAS